MVTFVTSGLWDTEIIKDQLAVFTRTTKWLANLVHWSFQGNNCKFSELKWKWNNICASYLTVWFLSKWQSSGESQIKYSGIKITDIILFIWYLGLFHKSIIHNVFSKIYALYHLCLLGSLATGKYLHFRFVSHLL